MELWQLPTSPPLPAKTRGSPWSEVTSEAITILFGFTISDLPPARGQRATRSGCTGPKLILQVVPRDGRCLSVSALVYFQRDVARPLGHPCPFMVCFMQEISGRKRGGKATWNQLLCWQRTATGPSCESERCVWGRDAPLLPRHPKNRNPERVNNHCRGFSGGPEVKALCFHCSGHGFDPWPEN